MSTASGEAVEVGTWRYVKHGTAGQAALIFVVNVSDRGVVRFVKPNPWALREGDTRGGWTKAQTCKVADVLLVRPHAGEIDQVVRAIGRPPGGGA